MVVKNCGKIINSIGRTGTFVVLLIALTTSMVIPATDQIVRAVTFPIRTDAVFNLLPDPFYNKPRTLILTTSDSLWNNHFVDPNLARRSAGQQVSKIVITTEAALIDNAFILRILHQDKDIITPIAVPFDWYLKRAYKFNLYNEFTKKIVKRFTNPPKFNSRNNRASLRLISTNIGNTAVALNIRGDIYITGDIIFQDKETTNTNFRDSKSWDLDINQRQNFTIDGTIGDRLTVEVDQDSESDFAWENNLVLNYQGKKDDIWQSGVAGNLSLNLPSTAGYVNGGTTRSSGLFGIKTVHQLGPLNITSIVSREQVKKASKNFTGSESEQDFVLHDYDFVKDKYFYVDSTFKAHYYPLSKASNSYHSPINTNRTLYGYKLFKKDQTNGTIDGVAYFVSDTTIRENGLWTELKQNVDYEINPRSGIIKLLTSVSTSALGIAYLAGYTEEDDEGNVSILTDEIDCEITGDCYGDWDYINTQEDFDDLNENGMWDSTEVIIHVDEAHFIYFDPTISQWFVDINDNLEYNIGIDEDIITDEFTNPFTDLDGHRLFEDTNSNNVWDDVIEPYTDSNENGVYDAGTRIHLKLLKQDGASSVSKVTWPYMLKNVYNLGATNIDPESFEINIIHEKGLLTTEEFSPNGTSFLNIFGLDDLNNGVYQAGGDGIIDATSSLVNFSAGELWFPMHLPFAPDSHAWTDANGNYINKFGAPLAPDSTAGFVYWGNPHPDLKLTIDSVNVTYLNDIDNDFNSDEGDTGPSYYYNTSNMNSQTQFIIKIKHSKKSSSINLGGFMIVEGSEEVRVNGQVKRRDQDYTIDYFGGNVNFNPINCPECVEPTAEVNISYEENEIVSFDQKVMVGTSMELNMGDNFQLGAVAMYYNQSIVDEKVDIGYEPVRNFIWDINGEYSIQNIDFLTNFADMIPFVETDKPSNFSVEGEFAEVLPNPNPLGEAYLDDFESSKRTTTLGVMQRNWKLAAPPIGKDNSTRGKIAWYNPYYDINTRDIWPNLETSSRANNQTTKILALQSFYNSEVGGDTLWNGVSTSLYSSDFQQSDSKYFDIWLNTEDMDHDSLKLHIDIGYVSEDQNQNGELDTEDEPLTPGGSYGNRQLDDGEDVGIDGCSDEKENGFGGCLIGDFTYSNPNNMADINTSPDVNPNDPNGDNWCYISNSCSDENDYRYINGTEGNGFMAGYTFPDSEDLNNDDSITDREDYFSYTLMPNIDVPISESELLNVKTGWKLFRVLLTEFTKKGSGSVDWDNVEFARIWYDGMPPEYFENNDPILMIAKMEIVRNEWLELGKAHADTLNFLPDTTFSVAVANTDENNDYESPPGVVGEYDEYYDVRAREQSLTLAFNSIDNGGGIEADHIVAANKFITQSSGFDSNSFLAYRKMEMYVLGKADESVESSTWTAPTDSTSIDLVFQFGKDDNNYYEIRKPVYEGWDDRNHIDIDLQSMVRYKINITSLDVSLDSGYDMANNNLEDGCGGEILALTYATVMDSLGLLDMEFYRETFRDSIEICGNQYWNELVDGESRCLTCTIIDPNGDKWRDCGLDRLCEGDTGWFSTDEGENDDIWNPGEGLEGNFQFDFVDAGELNGLHDFGEISELFTDNNLNEQFDLPPDNYNLDLGYYEFSETPDCSVCEKIRVKGNPSIDRINFLKLGVENNTEERVFGTVMVDELRMTGVKKERGRAMRLKTTINFADLLDISTEITHKDADFHSLRDRLGSANTVQTYSLNTRFYPDKFLPSAWGVKTPISVNFNRSVKSPKYYKGTDILAGDYNSIPDSIQTITRSLNINTSYRKTSKSKNWFLKYTLDNFSISNLTAKYTFASSETVFSDKLEKYSGNAVYKINFGDHYVKPFEKLDKTPIIGNFIRDIRLYWMPKYFESSLGLDTENKVVKQRAGTITDNPKFKMTRKFKLDYQITKSFNTTYNKNINSDLLEYINDKTGFIADMSPGRIENITESLKNSFSPDFLKWLKPSVSYNTAYSWSRSNSTSPVAVSSNSDINFRSTISLKNLIEQFYTPAGGASSSRTRRGSNNRNKNPQTQKKKKEIKNPVILAIVKPIHTFSTKISNISLTYKDQWSHQFGGLEGSPSALFRLGLNGDPEMSIYEDQNPTSSHQYVKDFSVNTTVSISRKLSATIKYSQNKKRTERYLEEDSKDEKMSFLPLGDRGEDGFPMFTWNVSWSGIEQFFIFKKFFKSMSFSHTYQGDKTIQFRGLENTGSDYNMQFSPLLGINAKTNTKKPIDVTFSIKHTLNIKNTGAHTLRKFTDGLSSSISYRHQGGLDIPIFFFRDFEFENNITMKLNVSYDKNYEKERTTFDGKFTDRNSSSNFSIRPDITYSFTKYVDGSIHFSYSIHDNSTTKRRTEKDFGFDIHIKIRG